MTLVATVSQDASFGARFLAKHPAYTVTAFLTLVLTIAAVTTMFSLVSQVLLRPLPVPNPEQLVSIEIRSTQTGGRERSESIPFAVFEDWRAAMPDALDIAWHVIESSVLTETDIGVYSAGNLVSHNFLSLVGVEPLLGRWFGEDDAGQPVLVISHDMWRQDLGRDERIIGRSISLDKKPYTVIGVMPQGFLRFLEPRIRYWRPIDDFGRGGGVLGRVHADSVRGVLESASGPFNRILQNAPRWARRGRGWSAS